VGRRTGAQTALAIGALGVVFGDIGTSPLYTIQAVFNLHDPHPVTATRESVFGIVSLIFWSVTIVVTVTYVLLAMWADNDGEGGIPGVDHVDPAGEPPGGCRTRAALAALGVFGASLVFGDSMITPAISVLPAIEGVKVAAPQVYRPTGRPQYAID
jgi:KUP system potassium uptake protein